MKTKVLALMLCFSTSLAIAGEGMWLPLLLKSLNESEMQSMGMKLSAEDIYSINQGSLKDAIVHFGGFCTSEIISPNGLLLTNHHCGYGQIQSHSTVENNLLKNGFWAGSFEEELPNQGLTATLIDRIDDVSIIILEGVEEGMSSSERQSIIDKNIADYRSTQNLESYQELIIRPFYNGNEYYAFTTTVYRDVRLVGVPPESIGKFGADTDNWVWPRHTGDFGLFRIYAGPDNLPADYSEDNVPYQPKHFLPISLDGVEEGDFTMVFGFPGRTSEYLPSPAIETIVNTVNPAKIAIREKALDIVGKYMKQDEKTRIQYASKFASIANYWKKWIGESLGLSKTDAIGKKKRLEQEFSEKIGDDSSYSNLLPEFDMLYEKIEPYDLTSSIYGEITGRNVELLRVATYTQRLVGRYENNGENGYNGYLGRLQPFLEGFYEDFNAKIDQEVFAALIDIYTSSVDPMYIPESLSQSEDYDALALDLYSNTVFTDYRVLDSIFNLPAAEAVAIFKSDPVYIFASDWKMLFDQQVGSNYNLYKTQIDSLQRIYMKALRETFPEKRFYPDANSTMRITYGQVNGYNPRDAVYYNPVTYLDGVIEKYVPGDYEFDVNPKLIELYENKDYGQYADSNGKLPICFLGSNHTTGGNSGSPAIDAHGNLIGLNFDRVWEGTMSDYNYDPLICRNIMVDVRYILFVVDKYAGASHLIDEMELVHPKQ